MSTDNEAVTKAIVECQFKAAKRALLNALIESKASATAIEATRRTVDDARNKEFASAPSMDKGPPINGRRIRYGTTLETWGPFDQFDLFQHLDIIPAPDKN